MSAQLMALVRELKALNARKKAGETLPADQEARRKELKAFLKSQLEGGGGEEESTTSAARPPTTGAPSSAVGRPVSAAAPRPVPPQGPPPASASPSVAPRPAPPPASASPSVAPRPAPPPASASPSVAAAAPRPASSITTTTAVTRMPSVADAAPVRPEPPKAAPLKNPYAISGASSFIEAAMNSEAVAKVDPWANRKAQASASELQEAEARADAAIKANRKREPATTPDEVAKQLREVQGSYTPPDADYLVLEQYYGDYFSGGLTLAPAQDAADLKPIDPREIDLRRALDVTGGPASGTTTATTPPGLAFLDDFSALYSRKVLPPPLQDVVDEPEDASLLVGRRKVTVHMLNGEKKQGTIRALRRGELGFRLDTGSAQEEIAIAQIKAVFVHLQPNVTAKPTAGRAVTVTFRDQRSVQGDTNDYAPGQAVFTLSLPAGRGQFEKIVVNAGAVASVS
jgi:hypothetical protein